MPPKAAAAMKGQGKGNVRVVMYEAMRRVIEGAHDDDLRSAYASMTQVLSVLLEGVEEQTSLRNAPEFEAVRTDAYAVELLSLRRHREDTMGAVPTDMTLLWHLIGLCLCLRVAWWVMRRLHLREAIRVLIQGLREQGPTPAAAPAPAAPAPAPAAAPEPRRKDGENGETRVTFGKHKGKSFEEVYNTENSYVSWALEVTEQASASQGLKTLANYFHARNSGLMPGEI